MVNSSNDTKNFDNLKLGSMIGNYQPKNSCRNQF